MRRRKFIALLGGAAAAWPLAARAQQPSMPVIGFLHSVSADLYADQVRGFHHGLGEKGYAEGRNVLIEYRWAGDQYDRLPALAADLVHREVSVIVTNAPGALPAKAATTTIPIVFVTGVDPVAIGLVGSLARPDGNVTGVTTLNVEVVPKRLELLHEMVPAIPVIAALVNPTNPNAANVSNELRVAAGKLGIKLHILHASTEADFDGVFASLVQLRASGLVIATDPFLIGRSVQLAALTTRHAVPSIFQFRPFARAGGLMSYGGDSVELYRQIGIYAGRILRGEKPADLPVQQATKVELVINLNTAKALGISVPLSLLGRADEVIE
jgi:putative tryptophan/tyrosine transport system substrate-binding protein